VIGKDRPPGCDSWGPGNDAPGAATVAVIVGHQRDIHRFGQPSTFSLSPAELTAEVRRQRRDGWQGWEIRARFDFGTVTHAA
jgi:hypothetical protein